MAERIDNPDVEVLQPVFGFVIEVADVRRISEPDLLYERGRLTAGRAKADSHKIYYGTRTAGKSAGVITLPTAAR